MSLLHQLYCACPVRRYKPTARVSFPTRCPFLPIGCPQGKIRIFGRLPRACRIHVLELLTPALQIDFLGQVVGSIELCALRFRKTSRRTDTTSPSCEDIVKDKVRTASRETHTGCGSAGRGLHPTEVSRLLLRALDSRHPNSLPPPRWPRRGSEGQWSGRGRSGLRSIA
jgi:hypothetical protein